MLSLIASRDRPIGKLTRSGSIFAGWWNGDEWCQTNEDLPRLHAQVDR